jgi:putative component of membrane protein insertase Oxa1/YidC/SpoIIIJ protein YidD
MSAIADGVVLAGIGAYRRFISPHKGFRCAYGAMYGRGSCSDVALRIARRRGGLRALQLMRAQVARCRHAYTLAQVSDPEREQIKSEEPNKQLSRDCANWDGGCVTCCPWP